MLVDTVYDALKERIMDQAVPPGSRLTIELLAADLEVSPTPVREALARLAAERLVTFEPFKGYATMPLLSQRQLADLLHVRRLVEMDAARLAAARAIIADIRAMETELTAMAKLRPTPRYRQFRTYVQHDERFHKCLVKASGNSFLLDTFEGLHVHAQLARLVHEFGEFDNRENAVEHQAILDAVRAGDADTAAGTVRAHLDRYEWQLGEFIERSVSAPARRR
jgi:DNA-binding GntR family transcriptional regulator